MTGKPDQVDKTSIGGNGPIQPVVARRVHYGRWVGSAAVVWLVAMVVRAFILSPNLDWTTVGDFLFDSRVIDGLWRTLMLTSAAFTLSTTLGIVLATMRMSSNPAAKWIAFGYVTTMRSVPTLLQILLWFNLSLIFPKIKLGVPGTGLTFASWDTNSVITPFVAALLGLGLSQAAYYSEIVRGSLLGLDHGQRDAASALGMTGPITFRVVVLPQAMRILVPPTGNELIGLLKFTSLASVIAYHELLGTATIIYSSNLKTIELLVVVSFWFVVCTSVLNVVQFFIERHYGRGFGTSSRSSRTFMEILRGTWTLKGLTR